MKLGLFATVNAAVTKKLFFDEQQAFGALESCQVDMYPDKRVMATPEAFTVDLDLPAEQRWIEVGTKMSQKMQNDINVLMNTWRWVPGGFMDLLLRNVANLSKHMDPTFVGEMQGLADASGLTLGDIVFFNVIYELSAACTSIVAQDKDGYVIHGRNAGFGPYGGVDMNSLTWAMTETMKHDVIDVTYIKNGETVFKSTTFSGYIGSLTASKPGAFSMSSNARYKSDWSGVVDWIMGDYSGQLLAPFTRDVFEKCDDYECAYDAFSHTRLAKPVFFIIANGAAPEGAIITRGREGTDGVMELNSKTAGTNEPGSWYLVETNSEPDKKAPYWDTRRKAAEKCMRSKVMSNMTVNDVFDVLSTKPMLNMMTVFTTIMNPSSGSHETYVRSCDFPCPAW